MRPPTRQRRPSRTPNEPSPAVGSAWSGALQNVTQSSHEVLGLAEAFDDIHDQLQNNRVDNPDLMTRVSEHIAQPLHQLGESIDASNWKRSYNW